MSYNPRDWCTICGRQGHVAASCPVEERRRRGPRVRTGQRWLLRHVNIESSRSGISTVLLKKEAQ